MDIYIEKKNRILKNAKEKHKRCCSYIARRNQKGLLINTWL